ncbi:MAG: stage II sporulation protein M [Candidatus Competibacterales bacterium]
MKQKRFEEYHQGEWQRFAALLQTLEGSKRRWGRGRTGPPPPEDHLVTRDFPGAYRRLCQQLAVARDRHYSRPLVERLNHLALRAHQQLYRPPVLRLDRVVQFIGVDFPRRVRAEFSLVALGSLLFYGPLLAMGILVHQSPELIYSLMDPEQVRHLERAYDPSFDFQDGRDGESRLVMLGFYIYNNIGIGFRTFAGGMLFGVGSAFILVFNGVVIGAVAGLLISRGFAEPLFTFVIAHGAFELTAIVLAGVAGFKLGWALIAPGRHTRTQSLRRAAQRAIPLLYGFTGLLLLAALVEAFWSPRPLDPSLKYAVGASCWLLVVAYFALAGRRGSPTP